MVDDKADRLALVHHSFTCEDTEIRSLREGLGH